MQLVKLKQSSGLSIQIYKLPSANPADVCLLKLNSLFWFDFDEFCYIIRLRNFPNFKETTQYKK